MSDQVSTEIKIREAATKVFLNKGFDGATTRAIAQEAGMNLALVNYYFRSKEKLFTEIFEEMIRMFLEGMISVFNQPMSLKEKISHLIEHDFEMFKNHPDLVIFVISEVHRNPERFFKMVQLSPIKHLMDDNSIMHKQFQEAIDKGLVRSLNIDNAIFLIMSSMQTVFSTKYFLMHLKDMNEEDFKEFSIQQKEITKEMVLNYLFL